jgi:peptidoglycan hydrolase CwlO-like protein
MSYAINVLKANTREVKRKIERLENAIELCPHSKMETRKYINSLKDKLIILKGNLIDVAKTIKFLEDAK